MLLPIFQTDDKDLQLLQNKWSSILNPIIKNPATNPLILRDVTLTNGTTVINHLLSEKMQGWILIDISAPATIYRSQPLNSKTLTLTSDAPTTVAIMVF